MPTSALYFITTLFLGSLFFTGIIFHKNHENFVRKGNLLNNMIKKRKEDKGSSNNGKNVYLCVSVIEVVEKKSNIKFD